MTFINPADDERLFERELDPPDAPDDEVAADLDECDDDLHYDPYDGDDNG